MNRYFLLLIFFFSVGRTFGQSDQEFAIDLALKTRTTSEIENAEGKYKFVKQHWDLLNYGLVQSNYQLESKKKSDRIGLLTLTFNGEIVYMEVYNWELNEDYTGWKHNKIKSLTLDGFNTDTVNTQHLIRLPYRSTFGYACSVGGGMPEEGQLMMELVEKSNTTELINWLNSINPVRQAYAYLGFSLLVAQGTEIDIETMTQMNKLKSSDFLIYSCSGCTLWEPMPFSDLLTEENVQRFIERRTK